MFNLALILFCCWFVAIRFLVFPPTPHERGKPWLKKELPKVRLRKRKPDVELEQALVVLGMSRQTFRWFDLAALVCTALYEYCLTHDLVSTLFYVLIGRSLYRTYIAIKAGNLQQMQDAQTLQFVRGIKDNLSIESNLLEAVRNAAQQLKEPMRGELLLAINSTRGNRTLPEAIYDVGQRLHNPVYAQLSRIMEKGLKEGQREMTFAFERVEKSLREGEKLANKRAAKIRSYLNVLIGFIVFGIATPILELLFHSDVWRETTYLASWGWSIGAVFDLYLVNGLKKFTRLYVRRGGLMTR
jgi:hypothetical protein